MTPEFNDRFVWTDWNQLKQVPSEDVPVSVTVGIPQSILQEAADRAATRVKPTDSTATERSEPDAD